MPNQAIDLMINFNKKLDAIIQLKNKENYNIWTIFIIRILELYRLDKLIDFSFFKPQTDDPKFKT